MTTFDYYSFQISFATEIIKKEIDFISQSKYAKVYPIADYLLYLQSRIGIETKPYKLLYPKINVEYNKMNMADYTKNLDLITYQVPWNKLKLIHKQMKITEYINNLDYPKKIDPEKIEKNKKRLIKKILDGFKSKKFLKNKNEIIYDYDKMQITSVSFLVYDEKNGIYLLDWD